jgi:hypothetical protein
LVALLEVALPEAALLEVAHPEVVHPGVVQHAVDPAAGPVEAVLPLPEALAAWEFEQTQEARARTGLAVVQCYVVEASLLHRQEQGKVEHLEQVHTGSRVEPQTKVQRTVIALVQPVFAEEEQSLQAAVERRCFVWEHMGSGPTEVRLPEEVRSPLEDPEVDPLAGVGSVSRIPEAVLAVRRRRRGQVAGWRMESRQC